MLGDIELHIEGGEGGSIRAVVYNGMYSARLEEWQGRGTYRMRSQRTAGGGEGHGMPCPYRPLWMPRCVGRMGSFRGETGECLAPKGLAGSTQHASPEALWAMGGCVQRAYGERGDYSSSFASGDGLDGLLFSWLSGSESTPSFRKVSNPLRTVRRSATSSPSSCLSTSYT